MPISSIDTHKFVRRLEQAGMPVELAEVQAEVLNEAFTVNLETLVTKEFLESRLDARFSEQKSYIDSRIVELRSHIDTNDARLAARMDSNFRIQNWMLGFIVLVLILPYLENVVPL